MLFALSLSAAATNGAHTQSIYIYCSLSRSKLSFCRLSANNCRPNERMNVNIKTTRLAQKQQARHKAPNLWVLPPPSARRIHLSNSLPFALFGLSVVLLLTFTLFVIPRVLATARISGAQCGCTHTLAICMRQPIVSTCCVLLRLLHLLLLLLCLFYLVLVSVAKLLWNVN